MNVVLDLLDPVIAHDLMEVGLFLVSLVTSLVVGCVVFLLALFAPGMRL